MVWRPTFVDPHFEVCVMSPFWHQEFLRWLLEFWKMCRPLNYTVTFPFWIPKLYRDLSILNPLQFNNRVLVKLGIMGVQKLCLISGYISTLTWMETKYYDNKAGALGEIRTKYVHISRERCVRGTYEYSHRVSVDNQGIIQPHHDENLCTGRQTNSLHMETCSRTVFVLIKVVYCHRFCWLPC